MLKNINDYLSLITLVVLSLLSLKYFFGSVFDNGKEEIKSKSFTKDLTNYIDNEDE